MLLKSGKCLTQHDAGVLIGINGRQSEKLWKRYTSGGIDALLQRSKAGRPSKMNEAARLSLQAQLDDSHVATLQQACGFVLQQHGVVLTQQAMHYCFKRTGIKKKTGRPTNIRKDVEGAEMFKKTLC
jgi:transposase